jgi:hypothetical protein
MHVTPIKYSGKLLDIFCLVEEEVVDNLLTGLLMSKKKILMDFENESQIMSYLKEDLMISALKCDSVGSFLLPDSLEMFLR